MTRPARIPPGPPHDPDNVLLQLEPQECHDELVLAYAAELAGLTVEQMRAAVVAAEDAEVSSRVAWRERIRRAAPSTAESNSEVKETKNQ